MNEGILPTPGNRGKSLMDTALFYLVACLFMGISAFLSGIQWNEANGVREYLRLIILHKPQIVLVTAVIFVLSGVMMQIGKHHFTLTYYEISIIWIATSWVSLATLWLASGIKPSRAELAGIALCHVGLAISALSRVGGQG